MRPDIDIGTGNTHVERADGSDNSWRNEETIQQIVLVSKNSYANQYGPIFCIGEWGSLGKMDCIGIVPKTCYFPLINPEDEKSVSGEPEYIELSKIWSCLNKKTI